MFFFFFRANHGNHATSVRDFFSAAAFSKSVGGLSQVILHNMVSINRGSPSYHMLSSILDSDFPLKKQLSGYPHVRTPPGKMGDSHTPWWDFTKQHRLVVGWLWAGPGTLLGASGWNDGL